MVLALELVDTAKDINEISDDAARWARMPRIITLLPSQPQSQKLNELSRVVQNIIGSKVWYMVHTIPRPSISELFFFYYTFQEDIDDHILLWTFNVVSIDVRATNRKNSRFIVDSERYKPSYTVIY